MGRHDSDSWSDSLPETGSPGDANGGAPEDGKPRSAAGGAKPRGQPKPAAVGSLMSVQIRRKPAPHKRAPSGTAPGGTAPGGATGTAAKQALDPAARQPAARAAQPLAGANGATGNGNGNGEPRRGGEIIAYWTRLRGNRPYPAVADLDAELIATDWPNSILFRCRSGSGALMPDMSFLPRQDGGNGGPGRKADDGKIPLSPMMLQWLVSMAEDAVRNKRPVEDLESFPSARRAIGYRAVALPLSDDRSEIDHVLCHVKYA